MLDNKQQQILALSRTLHHNTTFPTYKLVGKTASADKQSVGKDYCRPMLSVGESPDGKALSRPTYLSRPTAWWLRGIFPDQQSVGPTMGLSRPTVCWGSHGPFPTDYWIGYSFPSNSLLGLALGFPNRLSDGVCFADQQSDNVYFWQPTVDQHFA